MAALATLPPEAGAPAGAGAGAAALRPAPPDRAPAVDAFLAHWRPDALLWVGGALRPALLARAAVPRLLLDGAPTPRLLMEGAAVPGLARAVVPLFARALVGGDAAAERLARAGMPEDRLEIAGDLEAPPSPPSCNERERRDLAQTFGARPVWLAADLAPSELPAVIAAHRFAARSAHRLLLIVAPRAPEDAAPLARELAQAGLRVAQRAEGEEPAETAQAYVADGPAEIGLWLRLAPVAYLGGTLPGGPGGRGPMEAAALGVALLHGPAVAPHGAAWARLDAAGAARVVLNGAEMGRAVEALLAADRVAAMAHAGWDEATKGAEVAGRAFDLVLRAMDGEPLGPAAAPG